jgi:hypothetical protein
MTYLIVSAGVALVFWFLGLGLSLIIVPVRWRRYVLLIAPTVGYCLLTLIGWRCYVANLRGTDAYAIWCIAAGAIVLAIAIWRERRRLEPTDSIVSRELVAPLVVSLIAFLLTSAPLLSLTDRLTSYSFGNSDIADSAAISTYLQKHNREDQSGFLGQTPILQDLAAKAIFGGCLATAFPASLLHLETYQLQSMSVHLHFMFSVLVMYVVARELLRYEHVGATIVCLLYAVSPVMFFTVCEGYQGQLVAMGVALLILLVHAEASRALSWSEIWRYLPLAILLNWGLSLSYPHMTLFAQAPVLGYVGLTCLRTRSLASAGRYLVLALVVTAVVYRMSVWRAECIIAYMQAMGSVKAGWFVPWMTLDRCLGFLPMGTLAEVLPTGQRAVVSLLFAATILWGLIKTFRHDPDAGCFAVATLTTVCSGCFLLALQEQEAGRLGGYKNYKFISFFLPVFLLASWTVLRQLQDWRSVVRSPAWVAALALILGVNLYSDRVLARGSMPHAQTVEENMAEVRLLSRATQVRSINLLSDRFWESMWLSNFLIDKRISYLSGSYSGRTASPLNGEWDLVPRRTIWDQGSFVHWKVVGDGVDLVNASHGIEINDRYTLVRRHALTTSQREMLALSVSLESGWKTTEHGCLAMNSWIGPARLLLRVPSDVLVRFRAVYRREPASPKLFVYLNEYEVGELAQQDHSTIDRLSLRTGDNILEFRPSPATDATGEAPQGFTFSALDFFMSAPATTATAIASRLESVSE